MSQITSIIRKKPILFLFKWKFRFSGYRFENLRMKQPPLFTSNVLRWMNSFIYVICSKRKFDMGINCAPFNTIGTWTWHKNVGWKRWFYCFIDSWFRIFCSIYISLKTIFSCMQVLNLFFSFDMVLLVLFIIYLYMIM